MASSPLHNHGDLRSDTRTPVTRTRAHPDRQTKGFLALMMLGYVPVLAAIWLLTSWRPNPNLVLVAVWGVLGVAGWIMADRFELRGDSLVHRTWRGPTRRYPVETLLLSGYGRELLASTSPDPIFSGTFLTTRLQRRLCAAGAHVVRGQALPVTGSLDDDELVATTPRTAPSTAFWIVVSVLVVASLGLGWSGGDVGGASTVVFSLVMCLPFLWAEHSVTRTETRLSTGEGRIAASLTHQYDRSFTYLGPMVSRLAFPAVDLVAYHAAEWLLLQSPDRKLKLRIVDGHTEAAAWCERAGARILKVREGVRSAHDCAPLIEELKRDRHEQKGSDRPMYFRVFSVSPSRAFAAHELILMLVLTLPLLGLIAVEELLEGNVDVGLWATIAGSLLLGGLSLALNRIVVRGEHVRVWLWGRRRYDGPASGLERDPSNDVVVLVGKYRLFWPR